MGLRELKIPTVKVAVGEPSDNNFLEVRGLAVEDLTILATSLGPQMAMLYGSVMRRAEVFQETPLDFDMTSAIIGALKDVPDLAASCIALAADDFSEETVVIARKLNALDQVALIEAIFALTFRSESEVKKVIESIAGAITRLALTLTEARLTLSQTGIGDFAEG